ncbi:hypothetical protein SDC9_142524 [bioreactor metagenome]|uniref:Uncharacterized protein n=1 Tax=bioreactor metagenome TaxID=1076179 RepID=A0A645E0T2_9ZZZZ
MPALIKRAGVDAHNIPRAYHLCGAGNAVDHGIVQRDARRCRKAVQAEKIRLSPLAEDIIVDDLVHVGGGDAGTYRFPAKLQSPCGDAASLTHQFNFLRCFYRDHFVTPRAFKTSAVVSTTSS